MDNLYYPIINLIYENGILAYKCCTMKRESVKIGKIHMENYPIEEMVNMCKIESNYEEAKQVLEKFSRDWWF